MSGPWRRAWGDHKPLLAIGAAYCVSTVLLAIWCGVPASNLMHIFGYLVTTFLICLVFLTGMYLATYLHFFFSGAGGLVTRWWAASRNLDIATRRYLDGDRWAYACVAFAATISDNFFFIAKSMIPIVNPYQAMKWDFDFMAWDKALHFGHYPHEILIPFVNSLGLAQAVDTNYALWLVVMLLVVCYNVFMDDRVHRRLRFLWTYMLSWIILGSAGAMWLSSVGPLFVHDFFPDRTDPYADILANLERVSASSFLFAAKSRQLLLEWAHNDRKFDPNNLSAMPSMHVAMAWLFVLYAREINRRVLAAALAFAGAIFVGTVYLGFHYAIDAYVSIACVSLIWWLAGKYLSRRYARDAKLQEAA